MIRYNISTDIYISFIQKVRDWAKDPKRISHGRPVLPFPPPDLKQAEYKNIELRAGDGHSVVTVKIRRHDLYIVGYVMDGTTNWLEFQPETGKPKVISGSRSLGFDGNYNSLGKPTNVGYTTFNFAIANLAGTEDSNKRKSSLAALAIMISESVRFQKLSDLFAKQMRGKTDTEFQSWMTILIDNWSDLSNRLLCEDQFHITFDLPGTKDRQPHVLTRTRELNMVISADAAQCVAVLLGNPPNQDDLQQGDYPLRWKGTRLLQFYSVSINKIDGEIYGKIEVKDDFGTYLLYNRERTDYEFIRNSQTLTLNGPTRGLSARCFKVSLDLKKLAKSPSADTEVSKGSFEYQVGDLNKIFDKRSFNTVSGKAGSSATFHFTAFRDAIQATIEVVLISGGNKDPVELYGSLLARYSNYQYRDEETKLYYGTALFKKPSKENNVKVRRGSPIPLSRPVIAVPTSDNLILNASFISASSGNYIAVGSAEFAPQLEGNSVKEIKGEYGQVRITVAWKVIPDSK